MGNIRRLYQRARTSSGDSPRRGDIPYLANVTFPGQVIAIELTRMGDVISSLQAVRWMAAHWPGARFSYFVGDQYAGLLQSLTLPPAIEVFPARHSLVGLGNAIRAARRLNADLACSMSPSKRNTALARGSGAACMVGYFAFRGTRVQHLTRTLVMARGIQLKRPIAYGREHLEERALKICDALGIVREGELPDLDIEPRRREIIGRSLVLRKVVPLNEYVVIHPFAGWKFRSWPLHSFRQLAAMVTRTLGVEVVFLFSPDDTLEEPAREAFAGHRWYCSDNLTESAVVIRNARLFVGNDSGPMHLAALLGVDRVGLYGPAPPELTGPRSGRSTYLYKPIACSPCDQMTCVRPDRSCLSFITPDEAFEAVKGSLGSSNLRVRAHV